MSEEKLTVAELLARAQQRGEGAARSDRPRRRRRSLEDGGVSVAELTGSIPKVRADGPRRGAHAAPDELEETTVETQGEGAGQDVAPDVAPDVAEAPEAPVVEETPGTAEDFDVPESELEAVADDEPVAEAPEFAEDEVLDEAVEDEAIEDEYVAEPIAEDEPVTEDEAVDDGRAPMAVPAAVPLDPRPVMTNDERDEVTFTFTKLHDADTGSWPVAEAGPVAREVLDGSQSHDDRPTTVLPVIEEPVNETAPQVRHPEPEPVVEGHDEYDDPDALDGTPVDGAYAEEDFVEEPAADYDPDRYDSDRYDSDHYENYREDAYGDDSLQDLRDGGYRSAGVEEWGAAGDRRDDADHWDTAAVPAAAAAVPAAASLSDDREVDEYAARAREDEDFDRVHADKHEAEDGAEVEVDEARDDRDGATAVPEKSAPAKKKLRRTKNGQLEDDSLSVGLLIVQTVVGLILGALAFVLFNFLWSVLPIAVCVVIALVFTFLLVLGVNMVRREKDGITPVLAGLVGLVVSFAPWLLTML